MDTTLLNTLILDSPVRQVTALGIVAAILLFLCRQFYVSALNDLRLRRIPRVGKSPWKVGIATARKDFLDHGRARIEEGYGLYRDSVFRIQTCDKERIVVPNQFADELQQLGPAYLNSKDAQCERHLAWYNYMDVVKQSELHANVCRVQLTKNINQVVESIIPQMSSSFKAEINNNDLPVDAQGYKTLPAYSTMFSTINRCVTAFLVGPSMSGNEKWLQTTMGYTMSAFAISAALRPKPAILRPFYYYFLPARLECKRHLYTGIELFRPIISGRKRGDKNFDLLQWMIDDAEGADGSPERLANKVMFIYLAAANASNMGITHALFDLCAMPEYQQPLREEIQAKLEQHGGWTAEAVRHMDKLDSFLRESQRLNHPGLFSFNRKVLKTIRLSNGTVIPKNTFIVMPTYCIARDEANYTDALTFDPWRFYNIRKSGDAASDGRAQLQSSTTINMAWGFGRGACPGRALASSQMKLIVAWTLMHYDIDFPEGQTERPENTYVDERIMPDRSQKLRFRERNWHL